MVKVKFYAYLRQQIGGIAFIELEIADNTKVSDVLERICENAPIRNALLDENNSLRGDITLLKNGREIKFLEGLQTPLEDGDDISIFPLVSGG